MDTGMGATALDIKVYCAVLTFQTQPSLTGGQQKKGFSQYCVPPSQASPSNPQSILLWSIEMQLETRAEEKRGSPWESRSKGLENLILATSHALREQISKQSMPSSPGGWGSRR